MDGQDRAKADGTARRERLYAEASAAHREAIARLAHAVERDADRARDLEQDMHLALWRSLTGFAGDCALSTWTYRVVHNVAADHARRETHAAPLVAIDEIDAPAAEDDIERSIDDRRTVARLHGLIRRLRPTDRSVILLYLEGSVAADIAAVTGLSAGNIAVKVHRIKAMLARNFDMGETA